MLTLVLFSTLMQAATTLPPPVFETRIEQQTSDPANVIESMFVAKDRDPAADPASPEWTGIKGVEAAKGFFGEAVGLLPTEIRSRWTQKNLYLLFSCPYKNLYLKPKPDTSAKTNELWNWDVAEAFIGSDYLKTSRYKEFQVSPQGEFVDLDIDLGDKARKGIEWQSGFTVAAQIDEKHNIWYGEMKIPFVSLDVKAPKAGDELRIGLYRIEGAEPHRIYVTWRATGANTFHVPSAFGSLVLK
jgi:cellulose/xylan binding protein with CBM9 domain